MGLRDHKHPHLKDPLSYSIEGMRHRKSLNGFHYCFNDIKIWMILGCVQHPIVGHESKSKIYCKEDRKKKKKSSMSNWLTKVCIDIIITDYRAILTDWVHKFWPFCFFIMHHHSEIWQCALWERAIHIGAIIINHY